MLLLRFIVSCSFCFFSNHACRSSSFTIFPISSSIIQQFVNVDQLFSYILVKEIRVINGISVLSFILILTVIHALNSSSRSYIRDKNKLTRNVGNFSDLLLFHFFYSFFYLFPSFVLSHLIERISFISQYRLSSTSTWFSYVN